MFKVGIRLVRSNRSNPALKQGLAKARFLQKEYYPTNIFSEGGQAGVEIVFAKPVASPAPAFWRDSDLAFDKACQEICVR